MTARSDEEWLEAYALPDRSTPRVRVNFVTSADGAVTLDGRSGALGGAGDRALMRVLRTLSDVVLVGAGTVRTEGYGGLNLPDHLTEWRRAAGLPAAPRIAIVSDSLSLDPELSVFRKAEMRPLVLTHAAAPAEARTALQSVTDVVNCGDSRVEPQRLLAELARQGLRQVLCEGGPGLFGTLLAADLVDEVCLTVSPTFVAGTAPRIAHSPVAARRDVRVANLLSDDEGFVYLRYERCQPRET